MAVFIINRKVLLEKIVAKTNKFIDEYSLIAQTDIVISKEADNIFTFIANEDFGCYKGKVLKLMNKLLSMIDNTSKNAYMQYLGGTLVDRGTGIITRYKGEIILINRPIHEGINNKGEIIITKRNIEYYEPVTEDEIRTFLMNVDEKQLMIIAKYFN